MSSFDSMVEYLDAAYPARGFIVPCLVGAPGIGKTAAVRQHASNVGAGKVITIIASQILPNEVSGITMPVPERHAMEIYDHYRLSSLQDGDILFFDELLEADQMVLSACLTLIESRMLMSGAMLPDVQIVAATNTTIQPTLLKTNIKQRFMWRSFDLDPEGCRQYIKSTYNVDIGSKLAGLIRDDGSDYNVLTPRSLTKLVGWLASADDLPQRKLIARQIDWTWGSSIGSELCSKFVDDPMNEIKRIVIDAVKDPDTAAAIEEMWLDDEVDVDTLMAYLEELPEWKDIELILSNTEAEEIQPEF